MARRPPTVREGRLNNLIKSGRQTRGGTRAGAGRRAGSKLARTVRREAAEARALAAIDVTAARTILELARVGFNDPRGFWDAAGNLRPIGQLTADQAACLAGFEAVIKNAQAGDGVTDLIHKIKFWDKTRALEMLAKHFGLLVDKVDHSGEIRISWKEQP